MEAHGEYPLKGRHWPSRKNSGQDQNSLPKTRRPECQTPSNLWPPWKKHVAVDIDIWVDHVRHGTCTWNTWYFHGKHELRSNVTQFRYVSIACANKPLNPLELWTWHKLKKLKKDEFLKIHDARWYPIRLSTASYSYNILSHPRHPTGRVAPTVQLLETNRTVPVPPQQPSNPGREPRTRSSLRP